MSTTDPLHLQATPGLLLTLPHLSTLVILSSALLQGMNSSSAMFTWSPLPYSIQWLLWNGWLLN